MLKDAELENVRPTPRNSEQASFGAKPSELLTPDEVAKQMGLSIETLAQWRSQGKGPMYVKISRNCVRYRQSDLDGWVAERIVRTDEKTLDRR